MATRLKHRITAINLRNNKHLPRLNLWGLGYCRVYSNTVTNFSRGTHALEASYDAGLMGCHLRTSSHQQRGNWPPQCLGPESAITGRDVLLGGGRGGQGSLWMITAPWAACTCAAAPSEEADIVITMQKAQSRVKKFFNWTLLSIYCMTLPSTP